MSKNYLIILKPLDWFFFGGERTHGEGDESDYLAKSNLFPQQSAVLGMLRYQLLKQNNLLTVTGVKKTPAEISAINDLVGTMSFNMTHKESVVDFKKIKKISSVCIAKENVNKSMGYDFYNPVPLDYGYEEEINFVEIDNLYLNRNIKSENKNTAKIIDDNNVFDHKTYNNYAKWQSQSGNIVNESDIWLDKRKIGITKPKEGENNNEKSFYKQEYLFFNKGFVYAFFAELDEELQSDKVFIGGQRSVFDMKVIPVNENTDVQKLHEQNIPLKERDNKRDNKIVLISDCFVESLEKLNNLCLFHWSASVPFRNIETTTEKENYHIKPKKSKIKYHFLQRGSVLYFEPNNRKKIEDLLNKNYLQTIGYNIFI
ncbi:MAG: CRISPR-associated protein Cmr3 [Bacteroidales bacterium]|jgi:CRISPR type III-B/RAMP module-associated protein Cmr3|nr:CRISPR-associated protein Cmr3 [Bacteroidales bacterium]